MLQTPRSHARAVSKPVCARTGGRAGPRVSTIVRIASPERPTLIDEPAPVQEQTLPQLEDPWEDPKWTKYKWTVYRGEAYDLTDFIERHPAGNWLINLSLGRDCTALFESYHLRPEVATARLQKLPKIPDFPVAAVPMSPRPNDSELYNAIRDRVRKEVFKGKVRIAKTFGLHVLLVLIPHSRLGSLICMHTCGQVVGASQVVVCDCDQCQHKPSWEAT